MSTFFRSSVSRSFTNSLRGFLIDRKSQSTSCSGRSYSTATRRTLKFKATPKIEDDGDYEIILPPEPIRWGVKHISPRAVPESIPRPPYASAVSSNRVANEDLDNTDPYHGDPYEGDGRILLGSESEERLRRAGALAKEVLREAGQLVKVGITTDEIDSLVHEYVISKGAYPSPLRYSGFPRSCCTSVNNIIVHGIPDGRPLKDGDIVNIDITVFLNGFHGDTSQTFLVGNVDELGKELVSATNEALEIGIRACGPGKPFKAIGSAIQEFVSPLGLSISQTYSGHGIGTVFHRPPWILHHRNDEPGTMLPGHCFTIEPALIRGPDATSWMFPDGWTASTVNGARAAQAEHTILITESGVDVLTR